jgi:DNA-binding response OmpR family regulator
MRILYVENHPVFADTVTRQFLAKHKVVVVPSIAAAEDELKQSTFDLLLVDYDLDDGKGDVLVRRVANGKTRIIGVSSHQAGNDALLRAGAQAVCGKMQFDEIETVIQRLSTDKNSIA